MSTPDVGILIAALFDIARQNRHADMDDDEIEEVRNTGSAEDGYDHIIDAARRALAEAGLPILTSKNHGVYESMIETYRQFRSANSAADSLEAVDGDAGSVD